MNKPRGTVFYIMGVSGSGKTTVGQLLGRELGLPFFDGDDYHPKANIRKMSQGEPLNDADRAPWLERIRTLALENSQRGCIIACSALKANYRDILAGGLPADVVWVFLEGDYHTILERMKKRTGHFMPEELLRSQFDTLETPKAAIHVSLEATPSEQVAEVISHWKSKRKSD